MKRCLDENEIAQFADWLVGNDVTETSEVVWLF